MGEITVTFDRIKKTALSYNPKFDYCVEYADAFFFCVHDDDAVGGPNQPVVVMKENGEVFSMIEYIQLGNADGTIIDEFNL